MASVSEGRRPLIWRILGLPVEDWIGVVLMAAILAIMSAQVFLRYVLNDSLVWSDEASRYLLVAVAFFGAATGVRKREHIRIDVIDYLLPRPVKRALHLLIDAIVLFYLAYVAWKAFDIVRIFHRRPSTAMGIPMSIPYSVIMFGFGLAAIRLVLGYVMPREPAAPRGEAARP